MFEITLTDISQFLDRFRNIRGAGIRTNFDQFQSAFIPLSDNIQFIQHEASQDARINATGFNVYKVLGLSRAETRTHSALLAHLLHPLENHGQGHLFLQSFLRHCYQTYSDFPLPSGSIHDGRWEVISEMIVPRYGRLDIIIRSPDLNYLCVIENKVDAFEQSQQLERYAKWLKGQRKFYPDQALIYLTTSGYAAVTAKEFEYFRMSYHQDIAEWLSSTLEQVQAQVVKVTLQQYIDLVSIL